KYLSLATRASILLITFKVVFTPTSLETRISSRLSKTSSSTLLFPATALLSLSKKEVLDFSSPLSSVSFFSLENIFLNKLIFSVVGFRLSVVPLYAPSPNSGEDCFKIAFRAILKTEGGEQKYEKPPSQKSGFF